MELKSAKINGKSVYCYVNDNGANIEVVKVKPNTFEEGLRKCCIVDIDIRCLVMISV